MTPTVELSTSSLTVNLSVSLCLSAVCLSVWSMYVCLSVCKPLDRQAVKGLDIYIPPLTLNDQQRFTIQSSVQTGNESEFDRWSMHTSCVRNCLSGTWLMRVELKDRNEMNGT